MNESNRKASLMARTVKPWVGKTDDSTPPPRVKVRIFERYGGICQLSGRKIRPGDKWQCDHRKALINGGTNDEDNLWPVLEGPHKEKTAQDVAEKSKVADIRKKHLGLKKPKGRPLPGTKASGIRKRMNGNVERW